VWSSLSAGMVRRGASTASGFEARKFTEAATGKCGHLVAVFGLHRHLSLHGPAAGLEAQGAWPAFQCAVVDPAVLQHGAEEVTQPPRQRARLRAVRAQRREGAHRRGEQRRKKHATHFLALLANFLEESTSTRGCRDHQLSRRNLEWGRVI
jgi:hypothetical protein